LATKDKWGVSPLGAHQTGEKRNRGGHWELQGDEETFENTGRGRKKRRNLSISRKIGENQTDKTKFRKKGSGSTRSPRKGTRETWGGKAGEVEKQNLMIPHALTRAQEGC